MSDHNHSNENEGYRDSWRRADDQTDQNETTSYYQYGPFQSVNREATPERGNTDGAEPMREQDVEVTVPSSVIPLPATYAVNPSRKKSSWKRLFASFMAGVIVVAGLMFAADQTNLFTGDDGITGSGGGSRNESNSVQAAAGDNGGSSVKNTAIDVVRPNNIAEIVNNSRAAVVKIETWAKVSSRSRGNSLFDDDFFRYFFDDNRIPRNNNRTDQEQKIGEGSGFIFDSEGYILTNQHVVDGAETIKVYLEGYDEPFIATTLGESVDLDLAALKIKGDKPFPSLRLGDVDQLNVGDWVVAIGNPYGYDHTVTVGVLSAKERPITIPDGQVVRQYEHLLQTDASINPGNSGGPLLNLSGEVIGINTAVNSQAQGIGFAIPTSTISEVLDNLKNDKPIPKEPAPYIGVVLGELDGDASEQLGYKGTEGALVTQVEVGGPAHKAGVQAWDIITEVAGTKMKTSEDIVKIVQKQKVGDKITIKVFRSGKTYEVAIIVGDRNAGQ